MKRRVHSSLRIYLRIKMKEILVKMLREPNEVSRSALLSSLKYILIKI